MTPTGLPVVAAPDPAPRPPAFRPPPGATDCHIHIIQEPRRFPLSPQRSYDPAPAPLDAYHRLRATLGTDRAVLVQPSVYGTDNSLLMQVLQAEPERFRGVAVVDDGVSEATLDDMAQAGVAGARANLLFGAGITLEAASRLAPRLGARNMHLQLLMTIAGARDELLALSHLPVALVFDHMGHFPAGKGTDFAEFDLMLELMKEGRAWVKLSAPYRLSTAGPPYADVRPIADALIEAAPDRVVWATDWPHPAIRGPMPNDGALLDCLADWAPDEEMRRRILVDNPAALYRWKP